MDAEAPPPEPAFSTYTAIAIFGLSIGAKAINTEWSYIHL